MYYPCSENEGADQLGGYREADLRLCFLHMQKVGLLISRKKYKQGADQPLISSAILSFACAESRFSQDSTYTGSRSDEKKNEEISLG